jgi:hypothetical protein
LKEGESFPVNFFFLFYVIYHYQTTFYYCSRMHRPAYNYLIELFLLGLAAMKTIKECKIWFFQPC